MTANETYPPSLTSPLLAVKSGIFFPISDSVQVHGKPGGGEEAPLLRYKTSSGSEVEFGASNFELRSDQGRRIAMDFQRIEFQELAGGAAGGRSEL